MQLFRSTKVLFLLSIVSFTMNLQVNAATRTFEISDDKGRDLVSFNSDAPVELIVGNTNKITGKVVLESNADGSLDLSKNPQANFDVELASIDTGIPLRNEHMRDNFLEAKKFPKANFVLKKLSSSPKSFKDGKKMQLKAQGDFSCHGVTVSKTIPVDVVYMKKCPNTESKRPGCDFLQLKATFPVSLKEHNIKRPEVVFAKLAETVFVTISATAYSKAEETSTSKQDTKSNSSQASKSNSVKESKKK